MSILPSGRSGAVGASSSLRTAVPRPPCRTGSLQQGELPTEHQLEKLEFALAVALTRGDQERSSQLRAQISALGGNSEEPGT